MTVQIHPTRTSPGAGRGEPAGGARGSVGSAPSEPARRGRGRPRRRSLTVHEVAAALDASAQLVSGLCALGVLPARRDASGSWLITDAALRSLLGSRLPRAFSFLTLAGALDVHVRTIKRQVADGVIYAVQVPGIGPRVPETELVRLLSAPAPISFCEEATHA